EAVISPDGRHIAFTRSVPRIPGTDEDGAPWSELWVLSSDAADPRPFITGKVNVRALQWTRDSRSIAFLARRGDDKFTAVYMIPIDGGEARKALSVESDISEFSLSPDGSRAAVLAAEPGSPDRKGLSETGFRQRVYEADWRYTRLWLGRPFGTEPPVPVSLTGSARLVRWSPVDNRLAVS